MIEASFAMQYPGKDLYDEQMDWREFSLLLHSLQKNTPLGQIVQIRSTNDPKVIEMFNDEQRKIRRNWQAFLERQYPQASNSDEQLANISDLQRILESAFQKQHS